MIYFLSKSKVITKDKRLLMLIVISTLAILALLLLDPIKQDSNYHQFADTRVIANIPHFFNVLSNLPFVAVGFLGIRLLLSGDLNTSIQRIRNAYLLFFIGVFLTGLGSSFYHCQPDNSSLVWDRLPMTISFMAFFCIVLSECISTEIGSRLLLPLTALGIATVAYWFISETNGNGDLRPYLLVQFLPIVLMPLILWLYDGSRKGCNFVWTVLGFYLLSKITELLDEQIYQFLQLLSGHTLKHLLASVATYSVYKALKNREKT